MAPHPPQTTRAWVGTTKRWASMPTTRLGSAIFSGGFHGIPGQHYRGISKVAAISMPTFHPLAKNAKTYPERKLAPPKLFSHTPGRRRINAVRCTSPTWGIREGPASGAAHRKRPFSDLQTASTQADCEQSTSPAPHRATLVPSISSPSSTADHDHERRTQSRLRPAQWQGPQRDGSRPPTNFERRRNVEARQPELTELHLSEDELKALGFAPGKPASQKS